MKAHTQVNRDVSGRRLMTTSLEKCFLSKSFEPRFMIYSHRERDAERWYCDGDQCSQPHANVRIRRQGHLMIPDIELYNLRSPRRLSCAEGIFVWLRPWHNIHYRGRDLSDHCMGYTFPIYTRYRLDGGWAPDPGIFFLEHNPAWGAWPSHESKLNVLQLLLSTQLGQAIRSSPRNTFCWALGNHIRDAETFDAMRPPTPSSA